MTISTHKAIKEMLNRFPEVRWDRYTEAGKERCFYGWIERADGRFDFLEILFMGAKVDSYMTSSRQYSLDFYKRIYGDEEGHIDCKRVENLFGDEVNSIKLHD